MLRKAVFLDRDGVINVFPGVDRFVLSKDEFTLMPGVREQLLRLKGAGFYLSLATNQSGIGRGLMSLDALHEIHDRMQRELGDAALDAIYYCPHHPEDGCVCRKPQPDLIARSCRENNLDVKRSYMVGDSGRDIEMGRAAGCKTILCAEGLPPLEKIEPRYRPDRLTSKITEAVDWILSH